VEDYSRIRQTADDNVMRRIHTAYWIYRATDTHSEYVIIIFIQGKICYANAPKFYVYFCIAFFVTVELPLPANNIQPFTFAIERLVSVHRIFLTAVKNKTYLVLHAKCPLFWSDFNLISSL